MTAPKRGRGRPPRDGKPEDNGGIWRWLVHDVDNVARRRDCSVLIACTHLSDGDWSEELPARIGGKLHPRVKVVWGNWKGMRPHTLERKYYAEKKRRRGE